MKQLRNATALMGLGTVIALIGCTDASSTAAATKAANKTETTTEAPATAAPAVPKTAIEQAAAALAASEAAGRDPNNPQGFHQALTPDGRKINVDLRETDWQSPDDGAVQFEEDYTKLDRPTKGGYPVLNGPEVEKLAAENPDKVRFQASSDAANPGREVPPTPTTTPASTGPVVIKAEPAILDLGTVTAGPDQATGIITLTNTGETPIKVLECKSTCGCTAAQSCPRDQFIAAGESRAIEIKVSPGESVSHSIDKIMTFKFENHSDVSVPVKAEVVAYVVSEPTTVNLESPDHKITLKAIDEVAFKIVRVDPSLVENLSAEPQVVHEINFSDEAWDALKRTRRLTFETDHPKIKNVSVRLFNPTPPVQTAEDAAAGKKRLAETRFLQAAKTGNLEQIQEILGGDVSLDLELVRERSGATPLILAAENGHLEAVRLLLDKGADVDSADNSGRTALAHAVQCPPKAECNKIEIVHLLLDHHADFTSPDRTGSAPLIWAAGPLGYHDAVVALVEAGANVNVSSILGTPLMQAAWFGRPETVSLLIEHGAELDAVGGPMGLTALATAAQYSSNPQTIQALLNAGADPSIKSNNGTALDIARSRTDDAAKQIVVLLEKAMGETAKPATASGDSSKPAAEPNKPANPS